MYEDLDRVRLKSGEQVEMGVVSGPDQEWASKVEVLLGHKGENWLWGNSRLLRDDLGIEGLFYILHRDGVPFANMMNVEFEGVGIFGHVYTVPEDRRQHAASELMPHLMSHFRARGGKALFLGTGFDSHAYHIYNANGFEGVEVFSGSMSYYRDSQSDFETSYFGQGAVSIEALDWIHWPVSPALFMVRRPGTIRLAGLGLFGQGSTEGSMLPLIRETLERREEGKPSRMMVLRHEESSAVTGVAMHSRDRLWPHTCVVDLYCHPQFWDHGRSLLHSLSLPEADRYIAYCDLDFSEKEEILSSAGFVKNSVHEQRVAVNRAKTEYVDVGVWER
jgi:GNAT superfamily N-acetyltransferase